MKQRVADRVAGDCASPARGSSRCSLSACASAAATPERAAGRSASRSSRRRTTTLSSRRKPSAAASGRASSATRCSSTRTTTMRNKQDQLIDVAIARRRVGDHPGQRRRRRVGRRRAEGQGSRDPELPDRSRDQRRPASPWRQIVSNNYQGADAGGRGVRAAARGEGHLRRARRARNPTLTPPCAAAVFTTSSTNIRA